MPLPLSLVLPSFMTTVTLWTSPTPYHILLSLFSAQAYFSAGLDNHSMASSGGQPLPLPPPLLPQPQQQQQQQHQQRQASNCSTANPEIFVRRLFKPRLYDQVSIGAGVARQLASINRRMSAGTSSRNSGGNGFAPPTVLAAEVVQSDFLMQSCLALPEEFGKIYLGETFCAYVSVVNTLPCSIYILEAHASLKSSRSTEVPLQNMAATRQADLEGLDPPPLPLPGQWGGLGVSRERPRELRPGENLDVVVEHVLQELDWHYLAIKLEFTSTAKHAGGGGVGFGGEGPRPMMKRFKFKVYNPVSLTTTQKALPTGEVLLQAQVKNITERHTSLLLEDVVFLAEEGLRAEMVVVPSSKDVVRRRRGGGVSRSSSETRKENEYDIDDSEEDEDLLDCVAAFDRHVYLLPEDVVQYIYRLRPDIQQQQQSQALPLVLAAGIPLGQLRVSWRTTLGEAGTLLSPRVHCSPDVATAFRPVELRLVRPLTASMGLEKEEKQQDEEEGEGAGVLVQGQVYTADCELHNNTEKDLWLQVQFHLDTMQGVYVTGKSFQNAGLVPAHGTQRLTFQLLPLMAGLHDVKGLIILDLVTAQEFQQERLCEVMVVRRSGSSVGYGKQRGQQQESLVRVDHSWGNN